MPGWARSWMIVRLCWFSRPVKRRERSRGVTSAGRFGARQGTRDRGRAAGRRRRVRPAGPDARAGRAARARELQGGPGRDLLGPGRPGRAGDGGGHLGAVAGERLQRTGVRSPGSQARGPRRGAGDLPHRPARGPHRGAGAAGRGLARAGRRGLLPGRPGGPQGRGAPPGAALPRRPGPGHRGRPARPGRRPRGPAGGRRRRLHRRAGPHPHRPHARHRRHHPARAGRGDPLARRRQRGGDRRSRHRQDRGRAAPGGLADVPAPAPLRLARRAGGRAEPALHRVHRTGAALPRRGRRGAALARRRGERRRGHPARGRGAGQAEGLAAHGADPAQGGQRRAVGRAEGRPADLPGHVLHPGRAAAVGAARADAARRQPAAERGARRRHPLPAGRRLERLPGRQARRRRRLALRRVPGPVRGRQAHLPVRAALRAAVRGLRDRLVAPAHPAGGAALARRSGVPGRGLARGAQRLRRAAAGRVVARGGGGAAPDCPTRTSRCWTSWTRCSARARGRRARPPRRTRTSWTA